MGIFTMNQNKREVDDRRVIVNDFVRRAPFWSYRVKDYQIYPPFADYQKEIDAYLEKLFSGELDDGNGDVLDNLISDMFHKAKQDLNRQRQEHHDAIKSFWIRFQGDRRAFENELDLLKVSLQETIKEQPDIDKKLRKSEFKEEH